MKLYNTLSRSVQEFQPVDKERVTIYTCGPTVYNYAHIGNLRTFLFEDFLRRALKYLGYRVFQIMNITDVDDKTISAGDGKMGKFKELTKKFEEIFWQDLSKLNIEKPESTPRATEHIEQIVAFVSDLLKKGYAYKGDDGSIYFSIDKFKDYGKLSQLDKSGIKSGARVSQDAYSKDNPADFVLWKAWDEEDGEIYWDTELGKGRPGWHIECSAMSGDKVEGTIDIHAGAVDLIFPHHENEIAQSEAKEGRKFVNFWLHAEHLLVDSKKMSKSLNNFYTLGDIEEKGYSALDFRYLTLTAHWRDKLNFSWDSLESAKNTLSRAKKIVSGISEIGKADEEYSKKFKSALENDLNMPEAIAVFWQMLRDDKIKSEDKKATALDFDRVLGLNLTKTEKIEVPDEVKKLVSEREKARSEKDYARADKLREQIEKLGYIVEDSEGKSKVSKK
ncbi:MAG: cysteine--tRNA ligase [Patescibacteria group bacterium]|nr:cysteine--tRNA ligase [Patescibacteria group bacterium]